MSLQKQITLILLVVIAIFAGLDHAVQRFVVFPRYRQIDQANAELEMKRSLVSLDREIQHLDHLGQDWAARADLASILSAGRISPEKSTQLAAELSISRLDFCYLLDRRGLVVWGNNISGVSQSAGVEAAILGATGQAGNGSSPVIRNSAGLLRSKLGVVVVASYQVTRASESGEVVGSCLAGYFLDKERLLALARQTGVLLELGGCDCEPPHDHLGEKCLLNSCGFEGGEKLTNAEVAALVAIGPERPVLVRKLGGDRLECLADFPDLFGRHTLLLKGVLPMPITTMGRDVLNGALLALLTAGLMIVVVLREAIKMSVLKPLSLLTRHAVSLRSSESHAGQISGVLRSPNELGVLAREFDSMVERLATARRQLVEQSYYSGMTEVASRVMHSLRNAMTPITAHLDLLREEFRDLPLEQMKMAGRELAGDEVPPERREMLARYLKESVDYIVGVMGDAAVRLKGMDAGVAAIEKILAEQEKFAGRDRRSEPVDLNNLLREAGALLSLNYYSGLELVIDPSLAEVGPVNGRRHALLHIFTNLISNAIEAILLSERSNGRIEIRAEIDEIAYPGLVHVTVSDNGCGIAQGDLGRLFERGYTTKEHDSSGIGLHWCANTIATMHGRLFAESAGLGRGSVMHLLIPRGGGQTMEPSRS
jgi:signal transduction histidine kinase/sensor domain CHASE-containing protein